MANKLDNLIPFEKGRSREEAQRNGRKGGIASGEARRRKATMKETLRMMLDETASNGQTFRDMATLGLIKGAVKGNSQNYRVILETLGELYATEEKKQQNGVIDNLIEALNNVKNTR